MRWWSLFGLCLIASVARAQTVKKSKSVVEPTTLSGVYTAEQAARGSNVYAGQCRACHTPQSHTGAAFETLWGGKPLSELFVFIGSRMPLNDPGSLAPEDVADVVAYLLELNAMPAGKRELYPHADSLKQYRVELKSRGSKAENREPRAKP
jgi:mono/diheme cytochrome c family protein